MSLERELNLHSILPDRVDVIIGAAAKAWCRPDRGVATDACAREKVIKE
jgi:hypothetical protein